MKFTRTEEEIMDYVTFVEGGVIQKLRENPQDANYGYGLGFIDGAKSVIKFATGFVRTK